MRHVTLLACLLAAVALPLPAAADLHSVEVVIFARTSQDSGDDELLGENRRPLNLTGAVDPDDALDASRAALGARAQPDNVAVAGDVPPTAPHRLDTQARLLDANAGYRVLYHRAWVQEVDTQSNSVAVRVSDAPTPENPPMQTDAALQPGELDGTVRVYRGRYYQVDVRVEYRPRGAYQRPADPYAAAPAYPEISPVYVIDQHRRIKTGETQYFDHPRLGVLLRVDEMKPADGKP
jgi:hypothetical protein